MIFPNSLSIIPKEIIAKAQEITVEKDQLKNQLTDVSIGNGITSIENETFSFNQLSNITIPGSVISIGRGAFRENRLTGVIIFI